ncbi:MAG: ribonuclease R [Planctomycetes bacterium]|nr:ribonuclease R [Planctomycetota bacterium]
MAERYLEAIIRHLAGKNYQPLKVLQLARRMGVADSDYDAFRDAVKQLKDAGRVVLAAGNALSLPDVTDRVVGTYRASSRGFGFIVPNTPNALGDLFVPEGQSLDAITGDVVAARVIKHGRREGRKAYNGRIVEIIERGNSRFVGELDRADRPEPLWFALPQGRTLADPIVIEDVGPAAKVGQKVVVEIVRYPVGTELARGVIVETLGQAGPIDVETQAIIREHGLPDEFSEAVSADARTAATAFEGETDGDDREDFTALTVVTIDPTDARDYDDAISITAGKGGDFTLGVHIADVSAFVRQGSALDGEAQLRGNSVYFPRRVVPMIPEVLSNSVCSLQQGQLRYVKTVMIDYDADGCVLRSKFANAKIRSAKRLTYEQAQDILDGKIDGYDADVVRLVRAMQTLARRIQARRRKAGMLSLDLPEVKLVLDDDGGVIDAVQADNSYTHTIIEMFMVEANEAAARLLNRLGVPFLRRIHNDRGPETGGHLAEFIRACGYKIPKNIGRFDMQALIERVRGRPESYAVNMALLKTLEQAEYSTMHVGHFALASDCYCHFTSPIRRYPDLTVHRMIDDHLRGRLKENAQPDAAEMTALGKHCSFTERRAQEAERELRSLLVLQMLAGHVGELFDGVVTGITNFGVFVQSVKYLVDGLIKLEDLGDDWWEPNPKAGTVLAQRSGKVIRMGDLVTARITNVDLARRQLNLVLEARPGSGDKSATKTDKKSPKKGKRRPKKKAGKGS